MRLGRRELLRGGLLLGASTALPWPAFAADDVIDAAVTQTLAAFDIPGVAIALVRAGQPDLTRGYGLRTLGETAAVDAGTRFAIGSCSKAFTSAALAQMVDAGKLSWDRPVREILPDFAMYDPTTTALMTVRDLLVHRSGLPNGAGDLMLFPQTTHSRADVLHGLRYLKSVRGFRTGYDYDNVLYVVAGLVIEAISGKSWEDHVAEALIAPAGMTETATARTRLAGANVSGRHFRPGPPSLPPRSFAVVHQEYGPALNPAGGVNASARDLARWLHLQLAGGALPDGRRLWSAARSREMWAPQTIVAASDGATPDDPGLPVQASYALGWRVQDYRGHRMVFHSGLLAGQSTRTILIPALGLGLVVLTNADVTRATTALGNIIVDQCLAAPAFDWIGWARRGTEASLAAAVAELRQGQRAEPTGGPSLPLKAYAGLYRDPWYGDLEVRAAGRRLHIAFLKTPAFTGPADPWGQDAFRTRFADPRGEDVIATFHVADGRVDGVTMEAWSPLADEGPDFKRLDFRPV